MPYRRLPNTDQARLRALKTALDKGSRMNPREMAFSQKLLLNLRFFVPKYEQAIQQYLFSKEKQAKAGHQLGEHFKSARMYVSHFLQTLNMCIARGEIKASDRRFYGLSAGNKAVPEIGTEQQLIKWGQRTIDGEEKRTLQGGTRLFNPSIAKVKVHLEMFLESNNNHRNLVEYSQKMHSMVVGKRQEANRLILQVWDETEGTFSHLDAETRREACSAYGVVYIYRPNEREQDADRRIDHEEMEPTGLFRQTSGAGKTPRSV